ncbi:phosphatidylinositol 4-kinase [Aspergillus sclerotioniger CBS 115572]|uniref:1-phosphatidylinositol 4-kinase n=1 Tax=Aspergillus sclerotioniger CBS 115572 TaxID=1450535 RepID=A0A317VS42_9EURO|nr:phosphatidylinositol 4-kinase [Aspergillus sclerotioniger CBS 115572]PWY77156.1 phosphatidylinositol 4-kinase [Aspergillus sclerotioniger CBS 115572]
MDDLSTIRASALEKLAALAVKKPECGSDSDIARLAQQTLPSAYQSNDTLNSILQTQAPTSRVPMGMRELDVLVALCKASPSVTKFEHASRLASLLSQYLPESHSQLFRPSPFMHNVKPSPWENLTHNLTLALLSLGSSYPSLHDAVVGAFNGYLHNCAEAIKAVAPLHRYHSEANRNDAEFESFGVLSVSVSLVGFLGAAAEFTSFLSASEKLQIVNKLRSMLCEQFLVAVETASSTVRNATLPDNLLREWRKYTRRYDADGRPLGAMLLQEGFMKFVKACVTSLVGAHGLSEDEFLHGCLNYTGIARSPDDGEIALVHRVAAIIAEEFQLLEDGSDYLQLGSPWQQRLAFSMKALALIGYLSCIIVCEDTTNKDEFLSWLEDTLVDPNQMAQADLATAALRSMAIISQASVSVASSGSRSLLRFIVDGGAPTGYTGSVAGRCLAQILGVLSQDAVITTLYSLGNVLSSGSSTEKSYQSHLLGDTAVHGGASLPFSTIRTGSVVSFSADGEANNLSYKNVVRAIVTIATSCNDEKIGALAQSMLLQKIGRVNATIDAFIITETAAISLSTGQAEFQLLLKFYDRAYRDGVARAYSGVIAAVKSALTYLSVTLKRDSPLYNVYLVHLLENIVNKGDATDLDNERQKELALAADEISPLLRPLALLVSSEESQLGNAQIVADYDQDVSTLFRDAWFNIAVHGISIHSAVGQSHFEELRLLAKHSPPLVSEARMEATESDVELNTILRRGMSSQRLSEQKRDLITELPGHEAEVKRLSYPQVVFLNATLLVENLRALTGNCTRFLDYFRDPVLATAEMASCMGAIAEKIVACYLSLTLSGKYEDFSAPFLSRELAGFFIACSHRVERVQNVAVLCANKVINVCPSSLCEKHSLFALLELLTVMWRSCLEGELDEFEWNPSFTSPTGMVKADLPDNYNFRKRTLDVLLERSKAWVAAAMDIAPLDIKGLLQTYLSLSDDHAGYGNILLGRSFALEMGSLIPSSDQRLGSINIHGISKINVASDFISQYSTRQNYRTLYAQSGSSRNRMIRFSAPLAASEAMESTLCQLSAQIRSGDAVPIVEVRDMLRQAAGLLCSDNDPSAFLAQYLVQLPFQIFSKESMDIGISLWLGVMHENPRVESKILVEVIGAWERSIQRRRGLFDPSCNYVDPMFAKIDLLPSDKALMVKNQQKAQSALTPHFRVLQFFESHFAAVRLGNSQVQSLFCRLVDKTSVAFVQASGHPLARELHFRIVLFCLKVLKNTRFPDQNLVWKLKDQILSAALVWFKHPPRWSFGGNRLQIKAEDRILSDVASALADVAGIACHTHSSPKTLQARQELVQLLLEDERSRLRVWLYPLEPDRKHHMTQLAAVRSFTEDATNLLRLAWAEAPGLAIHLSTRFPSTKLKNDIRWLVLNFSEKAIDEPSALEILFGSTLPADVHTQLKYLLYWAPVNPTEALTYFLPAYGNHPFILQYAMKALESHSVDVRFYFVPQLVQALRYDALGYVERYILETAKLSQLFAHQVIWNMKANSYKDEDSQIPDPLKPTLDGFMDTLVSSFTDEERGFYEKEFSFFNEITGISGKLRPYIKRSKAEKKEKIEEELRKVKVEVGVYLPSNPDGVVVGIDRKSGKPLQSHAKAPYMATFRIQKTRASSDDDKAAQEVGDHPPDRSQETYEVWQSAIFKVGDDCRQDMLALQMIAAFRGIFTSVGLDVWVFPYRVTSTAPGCGVIDVLPNSISRDMLGREAVNGLYDYFISKYGGEESIRFQEARTNFVKSMAAYSVISYLLQFKDRHNGNIMIDDAGHIIHIDFGFCFDIAPGGVRFERAPFKLTSEMVAVMSGTQHTHTHASNSSGSGLSLPGGGSYSPTNTQPYRWFESLVVKAFLVSRPYSSKLSHIVSLMLDSGLPCFKPDTLKNFRDRFVLEKTEREAAEYMRELVRKSYMSVSTKGYDQFQLLTNGIPY